ncbi:hypothetical protein [Cupriavidus sp. DF5525]|uniref:hypothetical protein n=1 Tax=Cupriavidus sp. DF5525 TaxID=3160989 RepID=UPI0032DEBBDD
MILTDSLFSIDGDMVPLADWLAQADHDASIVDDAHCIRVLEARTGALAHLGLISERLISDTLGKACGVPLP